ncbi:hypothetical protein [Methylobacterium sp. CM6246]
MSMSPVDMEMILKFYMSKLSEQELAELDEKLAGGVPPEGEMASDAAIKRRQWIDLGPQARKAARDARQRRHAPAADSAEYARMFPHANRLG